jgi:uncharacterized protein
MRLIVSEIPDEGLEQRLDLSVLINESGNPDNVHVELQITKLGKKVLIRGTVNCSILLNCSRCLNDYSYPVDISFNEEYDPAGEKDGYEDRELGSEDLDLSCYRDDEIDVVELVKEQVLLSVPMKALCKDECRGICSRCGIDLNTGSCECRKEEVDPRLAPLQNLKLNMQDRKE